VTTADKTVIVTGGNSGLGFEAARAILKETDRWHVVIAGRSPERCEAAASRLSHGTGNPGVEAMVLDLGSLAAVRRFASDFSVRGLPPLRALVCNAGVQNVGSTQRTEDGFEGTFGVNHLGHFLLANLMRRHLETPSRIIFVSSGTHDPRQRTGMPAPLLREARSLAAPDDEEEARRSPGLVGRRRYTTSKLCNVLCAYEMDRRLKTGGASTTDRPISVNAFDPGLMPGTGLARDYGPLVRFAWNSLGPLLRSTLRPFHANVHRPDESGRALARLVLDPALENVSGRYFEGLAEIRSSAESYDETKAAALWEQSAELVGLSREEASLRRSPSVSLG
jgi:NAD(P)-dependent dehydrogenase (short-subunit alcohol dehydrogenase family)